MEILKKIMGKIMAGTEAKLDFLEENGLLCTNIDKYVGSGGFGYTKELKAPGKKEEPIKTIDMWGFGESQETSNVSPEMFEEFVFNFQLPLLERFGLNCYGCCEPLHSRWNVIKNIPNLRRVSVAPWANTEVMANQLEDKYVYVKKMKPTILAVPEMDKEAARKELRELMKKTKGCVLEIIMKDLNTIAKNPENVTNWVRIVKEEAGNF